MWGEELYERRSPQLYRRKRNSGLYSFRTLNLCDTGVALLRVYNEPIQ